MHCLRRPERAHPRHAGEIEKCESARPSRGPAQGPPPRLATNPLFTAFFNPLTKQRLHRRPRGAVSRFGYTQYSMTPPSRQPHRHHHLIPLNAPQHTSKRFCNRATRFLVLHTVDQQLLIISMSLIDSTPVGGAGSKTQKVELEHLFIRRRRESVSKLFVERCGSTSRRTHLHSHPSARDSNRGGAIVHSRKSGVCLHTVLVSPAYRPHSSYATHHTLVSLSAPSRTPFWLFSLDRKLALLE